MNITPLIFISSLVVPVGATIRSRDREIIPYSVYSTPYIERFAHFDLDGVVDNTARLHHFHSYLLGFQPSYTNKKEVKSKNTICHHHC